MNMYTLMMAIVLSLALFLRGNEVYRRRYIGISCFFMFVIMGLRDVTTIGIDSATSYLNGFSRLAETEWSTIILQLDEIKNMTFTLLMKIIHYLTDGNYQSFIIIYSGFVLTVFAWIIWKYSVNPVESFAYFWGLLCYNFLFDGLKQGLAMAFITIAFHMIIQRKPVKFLLYVFIAYLFHAPALIFLPAYWIALMPVGKGYLFLLISLMIFTNRFQEEILELMLQFYSTTIYDYDMRFLANKVLIMLVIVIAAVILRPPNKETDFIYNALLKFMGIAIVLQTFTSYNNTFERLANYYFQFAVIFIPLVFQRDKARSALLTPKLEFIAKTWAPWLFGGFGVWRFANYIQSTSWIWLPFRFYFQ